MPVSSRLRKRKLIFHHCLIPHSARTEAIREIEKDKLSVSKLKAHVELESEKQHVLKNRADINEFQNNRLLDNNSSLLKELELCRDRNKELQLELDKKRDAYLSLQTTHERTEIHLQRLER